MDGFVQENPANLSPDELAIVSDWKNAVVGSFYIFRYLKQYTVFLDDRSPPRAYGVIAVADPIQDLVGLHLPVLTQAVLRQLGPGHRVLPLNQLNDLTAGPALRIMSARALQSL